MSLLSAAVVKRVDHGNKPSHWKDDTKDLFKPVTSTDAWYSAFPGFDRGHLFPHMYAGSPDQGRETNRLSNVVPQDKTFNQGQWSWGEAHVLEYIKDCHTNLGQAVVVTGAVPGYFGEGGTQEELLRMKKTDENFPLPRIDKKDDKLSGGLTVPTHMWTQFFCAQPKTPPGAGAGGRGGARGGGGARRGGGSVQTKPVVAKPEKKAVKKQPGDKSGGRAIGGGSGSGSGDVLRDQDWKVRSQVSLIGLNHGSGILRFYNRGISETLKNMYAKSLKSMTYIPGEMVKKFENTDSPFKHDPDPNKEKFCKVGTSVDPSTLKCSLNRQVVEDAFWNNVNLNEIRRAWLKYLLAQIDPQSESNSATVIGMDVDSNANRKKRSTETRAPQPNVTVYSLNIIDADSSSNFKVKDCKILESVEDEVIETHVYDFETNTLIEDNDTGSGSKLNATYTNGTGIEVPADQETAPEVIQDVTVSISTSSNQTCSQNVSSYVLKVSDEDSSSDLELKDCTILEKSEGEVIETHVYDFEANTLIEDKKVDSGSTLTATYTEEDGAEVVAEKEVTQVETISIVLKPRRGGEL